MELHLKSLLPRSLYGRAALILVLPVVVIQLVVSVIFIQRHFDGVTRQMSRDVALEAQYLLAEVEAAPDLASAQSVARAVAAGLVMSVDLPATGVPPDSDQRDGLDLSGREVGSILHDALPGLTSVDLRANPREVALWIDTRYGMMQLSVPRSRVSASNPHQLLVVMLLASVLMTAVAFAFLRNQ